MRSLLVILGAMALASPLLAQPSPPPLNIIATSPVVVTPSGVGNTKRTISCPTCSISGAGAFPIIAAGATQSVGQMTVTGTDAGMAVVPNGNGGFMLAIPDATATGGNARGNHATDLQSIRTTAAMVASGNFSTILGGRGNTASGVGAIAGGTVNTASGQVSIALGDTNNATGQGAVALGQGNSVAQNGVGIGRSNSVTNDCFAVGEANTCSNASAIIGNNNSTTGGNTLMLGFNGNDHGSAGAMIAMTTNPGFVQFERDLLYGFVVGSATPFRLTFANAGGTAQFIGPVLPTNTQNNHGMHLRPIIIAVAAGTGSWNVMFTCTSGILYRNSGGTMSLTTITCSQTAATAGAPAFGTVPTVTLDAGNFGMNITVTPPAGNTDTIAANAWIESIYN